MKVCEENFVEGLAGVNISLRLLDCRRAGCNWHARSGRLELNDGRRHLENLDEVLVGRILNLWDVVVRLRCLVGWLGLVWRREGNIEEGEAGRLMAFDQTFFATGGPKAGLARPTIGARWWGRRNRSLLGWHAVPSTGSCKAALLMQVTAAFTCLHCEDTSGWGNYRSGYPVTALFILWAASTTGSVLRQSLRKARFVCLSSFPAQLLP